jgi:type I restriction enzyme R subunit
MIQVKLATDHIINIAATTFWGPDGKPISSKEFVERLFGDIPKLFSDEDDLLVQWGHPDTRKALLERLAERSYDESILAEMQKALFAEHSDIFDILSHIAYSKNMRTRQERADIGRRRIEDQYDPKLVTFLDYVLGSYVENGVGDLDRSKLSDYVKIKFGTAKECGNELGGMTTVVDAFIGFQKQLYTPSN